MKRRIADRLLAAGARVLAIAAMAMGGALTALGDIGDLAGAEDGRLARYITTAADYSAYESWMQANGLGLDDVTNSPNAWASYALDASGLINPQTGDVAIVTLEMATDGTFTFEVEVKDVPIGSSATAERLATVFEVEGTPSLLGSPFSSGSVNAALGISANGRLQVVATPKAAHKAFFVRVRLHAEDDGWPRSRGKVQLWAGGPYWAETNIGAENPEDFGYYFWWGDTVGYKYENGQWVASDGSSSGFSFVEENAPTHNITPATLQSEGWITADGVLAPEYDAAQVQWGEGWRMPTDQELKDLESKCDWTVASTNGVDGYIVRGKTGAYASASIFLPAAGYVEGTALYSEYSYASYWSSVIGPKPGGQYVSLTSQFLFLMAGSTTMIHKTVNNVRYDGRSIRPVQGAAE